MCLHWPLSLSFGALMRFEQMIFVWRPCSVTTRGGGAVADLVLVVEPPEPQAAKTNPKSAKKISRRATATSYAELSIRSSSASAPALSSGSLRLPHFGL
jgi:hypothetical protein